ncbi:MAG: GGDEF domain-containing protein [Deltaproteobacteria bacterium]|nr:GGDEF domain-containing protein [Deltaproteobacteria bacterium]
MFGSERTDLHEARDTIASILEILSMFSLPTRALSREVFQKKCEELSREVLLGPLDISHGRARRECYREIRHTVRNQRRIESSEYLAQKNAGRVLIEELVKNLERSLAEKDKDGREILAMLDDVMSAVETGDLQEVKNFAGRTAAKIKEIIERERAREQADLMELSHKLAKMQEELQIVKDEAERDPLTTLLNRRSLDAQLEGAIKNFEITGAKTALFMMDIDDFKQVNDIYGHQFGDTVLKSISRTVERSFLRKDDIVARYGGEEFAVVCRDVDESTAFILGERARRAIEKLQVLLEDMTLKVTISVGWAVAQKGESAENLVRRADQMLYEAKAAGKNTVRPLG